MFENEIFEYGVFDAEGFVGCATTYEDAIRIAQEWADGDYEIRFEKGEDFRAYEEF